MDSSTANLAWYVYRDVFLEVLTDLLECVHRCLPPSFLTPALQPFSTSSYLATSAQPKKIKDKRLRDLYASRQAQLRKEANLRRQTLLKQERAKSLGDPIRGVSTPFVESLDFSFSRDTASAVNSANFSVQSVTANPEQPAPSSETAQGNIVLDYGLTGEELDNALESSRALTEPLPISNKPTADKIREAADLKQWDARDLTSTEAVKRITMLSNSSNKHRTKKNIERIIETFGRHNTDQQLESRGRAGAGPDTGPSAVRAGPDTGSSEVQIGILTAKIRVLASQYTGKGRRDKVNKRNLRLLLHRRQKLLKYMERTERGSERWQHMVETLGLTPATWRGEIAVQ